MSTINATDREHSTPTPTIVSYPYIEAASPTAGGDTPRTFPRQILTGSLRGVLNITGSIIVTDPTTGLQSIAIDGSTGGINVAAKGSINIGTNISLSGSGDAIIVTNTDGSKVGLGKIPDASGDFGMFTTDPSGFLLFKIVGSTQYWYDKTYDTNNIQFGLMPDGTYNSAIAKPGNNVTDAFP